MRGFASVGSSGRLAGVLVVMMTAGLAMGQVVPPPTEAPPKTPEFTPPANPQVTAPKTPGNVEGAPKPDLNAEDATDTRMIGEQLKQGTIKLPADFNPDLLVRRGPDGKLVKLDRPLPWVALDENPLITPAEHEALKVFMDRRQLSHELGLVNDLDLAMKVEAGELDRLDPRDRRQLSWASSTQKQLRTAGKLSEWLFLRKAVTKEQAAAVQVLGDAYGKARLKEIREAAGEDRLAASTAITRETYKQWVEEPMYVYRRLLERTAENIDACVKGAELPTEILDLIKPEIEAVKAATTPEQKRATVTALLEKLPDWVMQHKLMDASVALRFPDRTGTMNGMVVKPVMAYQVELKRRMDKAAATGEQVPYQKAPARPR